jgi:4-hydroxybenzoate polyprenyltransferase
VSGGRPIKVGCWMAIAAAAVVAGAAFVDIGEVRKYFVAFAVVWGLVGVGIALNGVIDRWTGGKR